MMRGIRREEIAAYNQLTSLCYTYAMADFPVNPNMAEEQLRDYRGVFDENGRMQSAMIQQVMECRFAGETCRMIGIGGVVTDPVDRCGGGVRQLFEEGLPRLAREGGVLSALFPFNHAFYRKFGYELGEMHREANFDRDALRTDLPRPARIERLLPEDDAAPLAQVYNAYIRDKNFAVTRRDDMWAELRKGTPFKELKYTYLLRDSAGTPCAYWIGHTVKEADFRYRLALDDLAYTSPEACRMIFGMIRGMNEFTTVSLMVPADMEVRFLLKDAYNVRERTQCGAMVRILSVERGLAMLPAPLLPGSFTVVVTDEQIPQNNGAFCVTGDGYHLTVTPGRAEDADLQCSIGGLSMMMAGMLDFDGALAMGAGERCSDKNARFMAAVFVKRQMHLHQHF